jgi:glycosyltransferase involved in cell wall biosynthesis
VLELRSVRGTGGGPDKTILLGTAQTDRSRCQVTVCYLRDGRDPAYRLDQVASTLPVDYVEVRERGSLDPAIWRQVRDLVRSRRIDIVHSHEYKTNLLALLLSKVEPVAALATAHGWVGRHPRERYVYYPADRFVLSRFARVIAVSTDIREMLIGAGADPGRVTVLVNGIDPVAFRRERPKEAAARAALGLSPTETVVGSVGRLEAEKDYEGLIWAFARLPVAWGLRLVIAGDGTWRPRLERLVEGLGLSGRVRLLGHVGDVAALHHALDLFVLASRAEGTPNAVLEAMALETPVVATKVGGTPDLIRNDVDGLLVPAGDIEALSGAMCAALADRAAAERRARAARARVEREFSFEARVRRVESIYEELVAAEGPRSLRRAVRGQAPGFRTRRSKGTASDAGSPVAAGAVGRSSQQ